MKKRANNKKGVIAIGAVVSIIGVVLFIVVGIAVIKPMMSVGDKLAAQKCKTLFEAKVGLAEGLSEGMFDFLPQSMKNIATCGAFATALDSLEGTESTGRFIKRLF